jgi:Lon protease-like protein
MSQGPFEPASADDLPTQLPVFPLPGATLLPGTQLPLNIFEPRYVNMVLDALGGPRMIGMIQPQAGVLDAENPALYGIGCAGRIVSFAESADGRLLITLRGVCRYKTTDELPLLRGYRRCVADWGDFAADLQPATPLEHTVDELKAALGDYLRVKEVRVDWDGLSQVPTHSAVDFLSMNLPFAPNEKQALLEANNCTDRWQALLSITGMTSASPQHPFGETRH